MSCKTSLKRTKQYVLSNAADRLTKITRMNCMHWEVIDDFDNCGVSWGTESKNDWQLFMRELEEWSVRQGIHHFQGVLL